MIEVTRDKQQPPPVETITIRMSLVEAHDLMTYFRQAFHRPGQSFIADQIVSRLDTLGVR